MSGTLLLESPAYPSCSLMVIGASAAWSGRAKPVRRPRLPSLTKSKAEALAGTVWARAVGEAHFDSTDMWCSDVGVRQHVEPIVDASGTGCWWVRIWTTALAPEDLQPYWRQAFSRLRRDGIQSPRALTAAGYHLVGAGRTLTVEYSFNASQVTVEEVKQWARAWQDRVRAAFAERAEPFAARLP